MQDCSNDLTTSYHGEKQPHRTVKFYFSNSLKIFLSFFVIFSQFSFSAHAQDDIHDGVELSLIYPDSVNAGNPFHIYARVYNGSGKALVFPTITHPEWTENGYSYRRCISHCQEQADINPGETRVMPAGLFYASGDSLQAGELRIDGFRFFSLGLAELKNQLTPFDSFTTEVTLGNSASTPNPLLYPIPQKHSLQLIDHSHTGDQLLVHDPNTGYDWIRFELSRNRTANEILNAISPDGAFRDFKVARAFQVEELILNHLHAKGLPAQSSDLYSLPPRQHRSAIDEFLELIQPGQQVGTPAYILGAIADKPLAFDYQPGSISILRIFGTSEDTCGCAPAGGIHRGGMPMSIWEHSQPDLGAWLVRGASLPERPLDVSSLFDDELFIPVLLIDGNAYQAVLRLSDNISGVFILAELMPTEPTTGAPVFKADTGSIFIPRVEQINSDDSRVRYPLILELVPDTSPPAFMGTVPAQAGM
ncbi:MAG: hypothetical protein Q7L19_01665 [Pseudohongiella sp.]|nr:hypothetical protein [Pseudohongiella sp.]